MTLPDEAKPYLQRAVELFTHLQSSLPTLGKNRRGLMEAYFQLGRAQSFAKEHAEAEKSFRKSRDLAERWLGAEPDNDQASEMLASCYRKLADMRKFSQDLDGANRLYLKAVSMGEQLMADVPGNTEVQENLCTALHDRAGVLSKMGEPRESRLLLERAEKICTRLIASDPESVESQARLVWVLQDLGRIARDESDFGTAALNFERAGDVLLGLISRGKHENWPGLDARLLQNLREQAEECRDATLALAGVGVIRSREAGEAIRLLKTRARLSASRRSWPEFGESVVALLEVEPKLGKDLYAQARALGLCLISIDAAGSEIPLKERQALLNRCIARGLAALDQAASSGHFDISLVEQDEALTMIRHDPAYPELIARLKENALPPSGAQSALGVVREPQASRPAERQGPG
jgi:tetratricopeptide (TPR) repeat protein